jgi:DNA polymerase I-like protein with 3'-5' exonuclease and polymerase domains
VVNQGKNSPVQASGANMLKLSMISLPEEFPIVLTLHDQIILEVDKRDGKEAVRALKGVMEKAATYCTGIAGLIKVSPRITTNLSKY